MNTQQIQMKLKCNQYTNNCYIVVIPSDELIRNWKIYKRRGTGILIVNLDESYKPGSHWEFVTVKKSKN